MSAKLESRRADLVLQVEQMIAEWESNGGETYRELAARIVDHVFRECRVDVGEQST